MAQDPKGADSTKKLTGILGDVGDAIGNALATLNKASKLHSQAQQKPDLKQVQQLQDELKKAQIQMQAMSDMMKKMHEATAEALKNVRS